MENKKIISNADSLILDTVNEFCDAVCSTLGPGGRTVIISGDTPHVTKDGVTVSESINFADPAKNAIINLIKESARKTAQSVGDGTTTSTLLVKHMVNESFKLLKTEPARKAFLDAFDIAVSDIIEYLEDTKTVIEKDSELLESVIAISSNRDSEVIELVNKAVKAAGVDGIINVESTDNLVSTVEVTNGASLDTRVFVKDKTEKEQPHIVLIEGPITDIYQIEPILRAASQYRAQGQERKSYIIVAKEFSNEVQRVVEINQSRNAIDITLAEAEGFSSYRLEILRDIAAVTGAIIMSTDGSLKENLRDYSPICNGTVEKAIVGPNEIILFPYEDKYTSEVETLVKGLKAAYNEVKLDPNSAPSTHLKRRLSKYSSVATIKVGGATQAEVIEKKDRIDDAVCAVSAAVNGGVLPGGGMALYYAAKFLHRNRYHEDLPQPVKNAMRVVVQACAAPIITLCTNAGIDYTSILSSSSFDNGETNVLDIDTMEVGDAFKLGIIDPALVAINAMTNAASVTKTLLKSKVIIIPDE